MVSEEEGKPGIKVISDDDVVKTNRMDSEEEGKEKPGRQVNRMRTAK